MTQVVPTVVDHPETCMAPTGRRSHPKLLAALAAALLPGAVAAVDAPPALRCGTGVHAHEAAGLVALPQGGVFCPLLADPKAMRTFVSYQRGEFPKVTGAKDLGAIGIADGIGLVRIGGPRPGEGVQLGVEAGVFAQFDLGAPSDDLVNADYVVGFPLTFRVRDFSGRFRVYHQSSHLGDEFLGRTEIVNAGLSFEAVEAILSLEIEALRVYAGGEYLLSGAEPDTLEPMVAHAGLELRVGPLRGARLVAALDVKSSEQRDWDPAYSVRAGVEIAYGRSPDHPPRLLSIVGEYYDGPSPYGQFFLDETRFYGVGIHFQR
jgi:hypothetical protein